MRIERDDLTHPAVLALLDEHLASMRAASPPGSVHALPLDKLRAPDVTCWSAWDENGRLLAIGALKMLDATHGELKSMRTPAALRRIGAGRAMLVHLLGEARRRGLERVSLETGSQDAFFPARRLYASVGFVPCGAFADYPADDPSSVFMTRTL